MKYLIIGILALSLTFAPLQAKAQSEQELRAQLLVLLNQLLELQMQLMAQLALQTGQPAVAGEQIIVQEPDPPQEPTIEPEIPTIVASSPNTSRTIPVIRCTSLEQYTIEGLVPYYTVSGEFIFESWEDAQTGKQRGAQCNESTYTVPPEQYISFPSTTSKPCNSTIYSPTPEEKERWCSV